MSDTFFRYLLLLREIPLAPRRVDTATLAARLEKLGISVSRRTIQRDLERLARRLPLECHDASKPYGWTWAKPSSTRPGSSESLRDVVLRATKHLRDVDE